MKIVTVDKLLGSKILVVDALQRRTTLENNNMYKVGDSVLVVSGVIIKKVRKEEIAIQEV